MAWLGERILTAMPARQGCVTLRALASALGLEREAVEEAVARMAKRGLCVRARRGCYRRTVAGDAALQGGANLKSGRHGPPRRRDPGLRGRIWTALRMLKKATVIELLELALQGEEAAPASNNARRYLSHLATQGIVTRLARRAPGTHPQSRGQVQWLLVKDIGPDAPAGPVS